MEMFRTAKPRPRKNQSKHTDLPDGFSHIIKDVDFGTWLSVRLIEGVRLVGGPLNGGFTVFLV